MDCRPLIIVFLTSCFFNNLQGQENYEPIELIDSREVINTGIELFDDGNYNEAIDQFNRVEVYDTNYLLALYEKAYAYYMLKDYDEAIRLSRKCLKQKQDYVEAYVCLGKALDDRGDSDEAIEVYNQALERYPFNHLLWLNKGVLFEQNDEYNKAFKVYQDILSFNPMFSSSHLRLGLMCLKEGKGSQGLLSLATFLMLEPSSNRSLNVLGIMNLAAAGGYSDFGTAKVQALPNEMEDIDFLFQNKVALNKKYKIPGKLDYEVLKQLHMVFEQSIEQPDNGFWWDYYLPIFQKVMGNESFEDFSLLLLASFNNDKVQKTLNKNLKDVKDFRRWFVDTWYDLHKQAMYQDEEKTAFFYDDGSLSAFADTSSEGNASGNTTYFRTQGNKISEGRLNTQSEREGEWVFYFESGDTSQVANYSAGELDGTYTSFYENGALREEGNYKAGNLKGPLRSYHENGVVSLEESYVNGEADGQGKRWYANGQMSYSYNHKEGSLDGTFVSYFSNGNKSEEKTFAEGKLSGIRKGYFENGQLSFEESYAEGKLNGEYISYYKNGQIDSKGALTQGTKTGAWISYFSDGSISDKSAYDENGKLTGVEEYYAYDGELLAKWDYQKGVPKKLEVYDVDGNIVYSDEEHKDELYAKIYSPHRILSSEGSIKSGEYNGEWLIYLNDGALSYEKNYEMGKLNGVYVSYYNNGAQEYSLEFEDDQAKGSYVRRSKFGDVTDVGNYINGEQWGLWKEFYEGGLVEQEWYMTDGKTIHSNTSYYLNGHKMEMHVYDDDGVFIGFAKYDTTGALIDSVGLPNGYGKPRLRFENGQPSWTAEYVDNEPNGMFKWYYPDGTIRIEGEYQFGKRNGVWKRYFPDGTIEEKGTYQFGEKEGEWVQYYFGGALEKKSEYRFGKLQGKDIGYLPNGKKEFELNYYEGDRHGESKYYAPDGSLKIIRMYEHGMLTGYTYHDADGSIKPIIPIENETASIVAYYPNGQKSVEYQIDHGSFIGDFLHYSPSGEVLENVTYMDGYRNGSSAQYGMNGKPLIERTDRKGELHGSYSEYYPSGKLSMTGEYRLGERHGTFTYFNKSGTKLATIIYNTDEIIVQSK